MTNDTVSSGKPWFIIAVVACALCAAIIGAVMTYPEGRVGLSYYNGERELGLAYGCGMVAENNRLLKLQELKPITENEWCAKYRKLWEDK